MDNKKKCCACRCVKPAADFNKDHTKPGGLAYRCKMCLKKGREERLARTRKVPEEKVCRECGVVKKASEFGVNNGHTDGLQYYCKGCLKIRDEFKLDKIRKTLKVSDSKYCKRCGKTKSTSAFAKDRKCPDGFYHTCSACTKKIRDKKLKEVQANLVIPETKVCYQCKLEKKSSDFRKDKNRRDGLHYVCKLCAKILQDKKVASYKNNRIVPKKKICSSCGKEKDSSEFWKEDRTKDGLFSMCTSCSLVKKKEYNKSLGKKYVTNNRNRAKKWYSENKDHVKSYQKDYNDKNREYVRERALKREKERYRTDVRFRLTHILRRRLRQALVHQALDSKAGRTFDLLGCSLDYFKDYFESKFTVGMTWEKFLKGDIHIDHKKPCISFDLSKPGEQRLCFHYTNLQPLWAVDNIKKGARILEVA